jgi:hypothetical protein
VVDARNISAAHQNFSSQEKCCKPLMETRFDYLKLAPDGCKARLGIEKYLPSCGPGSALASLNQDAGLADQWLRVRFGYALQGSEGPSANRIPAVFAR